MRYNADELKELIPLYLIGKLTEDQQQMLEQAMKEVPQLRQEFTEFSEIRNLYREAEEDTPQPSDTVYKRIMDNIGEGKRTSVTERRGYLEILRGFFSSPRFSWGVAAVQVVIILFLLVGLPGQERMKTLSSGYSQNNGQVRINIVFKEDAREREIRDLINSIDGDIIGGPTPQGLYIIRIKDRRNIRDVIKYLKRYKIVRFAEAAY